MKRILSIVLLMALAVLTASITVWSLESSPETTTTLGAVNPTKMDLMTAKADNGEIITVSVGEMQSNPSPVEEEQPVLRGGIFSWLRGWLHVIDYPEEDAEKGISGFLISAPEVPGDLIRTLKTIVEGSDGYVPTLLFVVGMLIAGFGIELIVRKITARFTFQPDNFDQNSELGLGRFWGAILHILPSLVHIITFAFASAGIFIFSHAGRNQPVRSLFMAILVAIVLARTIRLISTFLCSPDIRGLRLLPLENQVADVAHRSITILAWYSSFSLMFITLLGDLGADPASLQFVSLLLGTILIILILAILLVKKKTVTASILNVDEGEEISWLRRQVAVTWHIPAILYFFGIWLIWLNSLLSGTLKDNGALLISLMIIPVYLLLDQIAQWLVRTVMTTLNIFQPSAPKNKLNSEDDQALKNTKEKEARFKKHMLRVLRLFIGVLLMIWVISLWGYNVPFAVNMVHIGFDILVTLTLAFFFWRITSDYIEKKLAESYKEEEEEEIDDTGEFGAIKHPRASSSKLLIGY
jgi:moderate conductance mechanosensitive channel